MSDLLKRARGLDTYGYQSQLACELADEIERLRAALEEIAHGKMEDAIWKACQALETKENSR